MQRNQMNELRVKTKKGKREGSQRAKQKTKQKKNKQPNKFRKLPSYSNMRNANKMADSLQLDGSKLKLTNKIPNNISTETLTSVQINANSINIDANKTKKSRCDKSENKAIDASGNDDGIIDSISSSLTLSTKNTNGVATSIYQVKKNF